MVREKFLRQPPPEIYQPLRAEVLKKCQSRRWALLVRISLPGDCLGNILLIAGLREIGNTEVAIEKLRGQKRVHTTATCQIAAGSPGG